MEVHKPGSVFEKPDFTVAVEPVEHAAHAVKEHDAVFGDITEEGPDYRNVGWMGSVVLMMKANIGLGVLSIPFVFQTVGMVPGAIIILVIQAIVTWCDYVVGSFKLKHREVYGIADAGRVMFGRVGEEFLAAAFCIYMIFVAGSGLISISVALNSISHHGTCTAVFVLVAAIMSFLLSSIRTLGQITWLGWIGIVSIISAILTLTISVGVQDRPSDAPQTGPWDKEIHIIGSPTFAEAMSAISSVTFAACATPTYFGIISEMRDPKRFTRSMITAQSLVTLVYLVIGLIVYGFCGQYVATPALGSAGPLMKRVCYGLAIPGLAVTITIYAHLPAKYIFVRLMRGSEHLTNNSWQHWTTWLGCTFGGTAIAYIVASAIPIFGNLISFIGAVFCPTMCMITMGLMYLHDNKRDSSEAPRTKWQTAGTAFAIFVIVLGAFLTVGGTYGAILSLIADKSKSKPWSCADNSV